jgi:hypothetical protein
MTSETNRPCQVVITRSAKNTRVVNENFEACFRIFEYKHQSESYKRERVAECTGGLSVSRWRFQLSKTFLTKILR